MGEPEIVGGLFVGAVTVMENAGSAVDAIPSLTLIKILEYVPVCVELGGPLSAPVAVLKVAHAGLF